MNEFPLVSKTGKRYRINEEGNHEYESGVILTPGGTLAPGTHGGGIITDSERGRELNEQRYEQARERAREAVHRAALQSPDYNGKLPLDAFAYLIERQAELALSPDLGRASTEAAKWVVRAGDWLPDRQSAPEGGASVRISLSGEALSQVLLQLAGERARRGGVLLPEATGGG